MHICLHVMAGVIELLIALDRRRHSLRLYLKKLKDDSATLNEYEHEAAVVHVIRLKIDLSSLCSKRLYIIVHDTIAANTIALRCKFGHSIVHSV